MKFAVIGGGGFIGSHLVKYLVSKEHDVTIIDNMFRGRLSNLKDVLDKVNLVKIDILDYEKLRNNLKNMDGIFHQAALTSVPESYVKKDEYQKVNVVGTENLFKIAQEFKIRVVYASSSSVYGNTTSVPISENFEKNPINPYGITKLDGEKLAEKYHKAGVSIIGLRYFNVYGIGQTPDYAGVITRFFDAIHNDMSPVIFGDGSQIRDFISVTDVADANYKAMTGETKFAFLNIGTGIATSIFDLAKLMIKLSKKNLEITFKSLPDGDVEKSLANMDFTKQTIGWSYTTHLEDGLRNLFFKDQDSSNF